MNRQYTFKEGIDQATKEKHLKVMCSHADMYMRDRHHIKVELGDLITITDHRGSTNIKVLDDRIVAEIQAFVTDEPLPQNPNESMIDPRNDFDSTGAETLWH